MVVVDWIFVLGDHLQPLLITLFQIDFLKTFWVTIGSFSTIGGDHSKLLETVVNEMRLATIFTGRLRNGNQLRHQLLIKLDIDYISLLLDSRCVEQFGRRQPMSGVVDGAVIGCFLILEAAFVE